MAKLYEECAKRVKVLLNDVQLKNDLNENLKIMQDTLKNPRLSDFGKEEVLKNIRKEFADRCKEQSEKIRAEIRRFCSEYAFEIPDDGESHSVEVANVLQVIDMMGINLTVETLKTAIEPIKGSGRLLKMVYDILKTKSQNIPPEAGTISIDIFSMLDEHLGMNDEILSYADEFEKVSCLLDADSLVEWQVFDDYDYGVSGRIFRMRDVTGYGVLCLPDNMMTIGKMYDRIKLTNPRFFG